MAKSVVHQKRSPPSMRDVVRAYGQAFGPIGAFNLDVDYNPNTELPFDGVNPGILLELMVSRGRERLRDLEALREGGSA